MAQSRDRQLDRVEGLDAAAAKVHCVYPGRDESREQAIARYEAANGLIGGGDLVVLIQTHFPNENEAVAAKPKIVSVQRKRAKRPAPAKPKPREWGGTTCQQPPPEHADGKRDPYDWRALDKRKLVYPDIYPSADAGAADERALRAYAQKLSRRTSL